MTGVPEFSTYDIYAFITKACLYNFDPLEPHFDIVKLGFTGVYIIFLISAQKHRLLVLVRTASPRRFLRVPTIYTLSRNMKTYQSFYLKFSVLEVKFSIYLNRHVFVMVSGSLNYLDWSSLFVAWTRNTKHVTYTILIFCPWKRRTQKKTKIGVSISLRSFKWQYCSLQGSTRPPAPLLPSIGLSGTRLSMIQEWAL